MYIYLKIKDQSNKMDNLLKKNTINIFTKNNCKYCTNVKEELSEIEAEMNIINMSDMEKEYYETVVTELKEKTKQNTFPFVFINEKFIGGYSEVKDKIIMSSLYDLLDEGNVKYNKDIALF